MESHIYIYIFLIKPSYEMSLYLLLIGLSKLILEWAKIKKSKSQYY